MTPSQATPAPIPLWERIGVILLALAAAAARWATRSPMPYNWDSVQYGLALSRYDLPLHQPHPPGSFYYVALARTLLPFTHDSHTALLLVSASSGALLVVLLFLLGRELAGREAGWLAAVSGASAPLFWFYGSLDLNYGPAGALSALTALACVRLCLGRSPLASALLAGAALGALGGFRPTDQAFLTPAYLWALSRAARGAGAAGPRLAAASVGLCGVVTLGWLVPNARSAGGLLPYVESVRSLGGLLGDSSVFGAGWYALAAALYTHGRCLEAMLGAGWVVLGIAGVQVFRDSGVRRCGKGSVPFAVVGPFVLLAVLPGFLFYLLGHFNSPGYSLVYSGLLAAAASALAVSGPGGVRRFFPAAPAAVALLNTLLFLHGSPWEAGRLGQRALSYAEIADHARYYRELREALPRFGRPGQVRVLASWTSEDGLRVAQSALREYAEDVVFVVPEGETAFAAGEGKAFVRVMSPRGIRAEGREVLAVVRTQEDPRHHRRSFRTGLEPVAIGPGHFVYRLRGQGRPREGAPARRRGDRPRRPLKGGAGTRVNDAPGTLPQAPQRTESE